MIAYLGLSKARGAADHIGHEHIIEAVAVEVADVDAHRKPTRFPKHGSRCGAEFALALVDPDPIG
jgi:hypothetical protein